MNYNNPYDYPQYKRVDNTFVSKELKDYGPRPLIINMEEITKDNDNYRLALWTGNHLQLTLMSIEVGGDIGLEVHHDVDQFIRIEEGEGLVQMGTSPDRFEIEQKIGADYAFIVPAGVWHNLVNTCKKPIKLYSIYAPVQHPHSTVQKTKAEAMNQEHYRNFYLYL